MKALRRDGAAVPRSERGVAFVPIATIRSTVAEDFGVEEARLSRRRGGAEKVAALYLARRLSGESGDRIGEAFGVKAARVSNVVTEVERGDWPKLKNRLKELEKRLREGRAG